MPLQKKDNLVRVTDIATSLGISTATVSRALNESTAHLVRKSLKQKIQDTASALGYINDQAARSLRTGKSKTIGVMIPDIQNPIFPALVRSIQNTLYQQGFVTLTTNTDNDVELAKMGIKNLLEHRVAGMIIASAFIQDESVEFCRTLNVPFVMANRVLKNDRGIYRVINDEIETIRLAVDHLYHAGHRSICHFTGPLSIFQGLDRYEAFLNYAKQYQIKASWIHCKEFSRDEGAGAARHFIDNNFNDTAIIAGNDLIAIGINHEFCKEGIRIPQDVSLVGINGMPFSEMFNPPLTTVAINYPEIGIRSAEMLVRLLNKDQSIDTEIKLAPQLIQRASTSTINSAH